VSGVFEPFPPSMHVSFLPKPLQRRGCQLCRRPATTRRPLDIPCERCGTWLHFECWWRRQLSRADRARFKTLATATGDPMTMVLCQGCRS
jgi:hypothetical protein